jgi:hypothetical protein
MWKNKVAAALTFILTLIVLTWLARKVFLVFVFTSGISIPVEDGELKAMYMLVGAIVFSLIGELSWR